MSFSGSFPAILLIRLYVVSRVAILVHVLHDMVHFFGLLHALGDGGLQKGEAVQDADHALVR